MPINLHHSPFSKAGSFLRVSTRNRSGTWRVMTSTARNVPFFDMNTPHSPKEYHEIALLEGQCELRYSAVATPTALTLSTQDGRRVRIAFADDNTLLLRIPATLSVRLLPVRSTNVVDRRGAFGCSILDFRGLCHQQVRTGSGASVSVERGVAIDGSTGPYSDVPHVVTFSPTSASEAYAAAFRISRHGDRWQEPLPAYEQVLAQREREWQEWLARRPEVPAHLSPAADEAWHVLWNCQVAPEALYRRRAILMSMNSMDRVWAWDNCFNAIGVAAADPQLAFDQIRLLLDHQAPTGSLPDAISDSVSYHTFTKPPVYGWTVMQLLDILGMDTCRDFIGEVYEPLVRLTRWWLEYRDSDGDGICDYLHGNDCGWDNCTAFDQGYPTEGADLGAHLVLQMSALAAMANLLGRAGEAWAWTERSQRHLQLLLSHSVRDGRFVSPLSGAHTAADTGCLLNYIPMELGRRLPDAIRATLVADLSPGGGYLTTHGLATQRPDSPQYKPNGYWRGPIWAPSTHLIWAGLHDAGESDLADTIADRFCRMAAGSPGMWENYDALTGRGQCCAGYSWTAASFLALASSLRHPDRPSVAFRRPGQAIGRGGLVRAGVSSR